MVRKILKNSVGLFTQQQTTILSGAAVIGFLGLLSALLGLVKVRLYAGILGAGPDYDTFTAAFRIPDLIFNLAVAGSINAAFIPLFGGFVANRSARSAWRFASQVLNLALVVLGLIGLLAFLLARPLSLLAAAGFTPDQLEILISLMRIMLLSPILLGVSAFVSGCLQVFRRFWLPFLAPLLYNLGAILGILFLYPLLGLEGLAWGVVLGAFLHLAIQVPLLRSLGFSYQPAWPWVSPQVRDWVRLSLPRTLGLAADQIKSLIVVNLASLLAVGSISLLKYAESIQALPVMLFGASIAQASLPTLSSQASLSQKEAFKHTLLSSLSQILYLTLPASVVLIVLKIPVVRLVLGVGRFDWAATVGTSWVLALLSVSLAAQAGNILLLRAFYAQQETKLPVVVSLTAAGVAILTGVVLMPFFQVNGLALGISLGAGLEFGLLFWLLHRRWQFDLKPLAIKAAKILFSTALMAVSIYVPVKALDQVFIDTRRVVNLVILVWLVLSFGGTTYLLSTFLLGCPEIQLFLRVLVRLRHWREASLRVIRYPEPQTPLK